MFCLKCGKEIQKDWACCPNCGEKIQQQNVRSSVKKKYGLKNLFVILAVIVLGVIIFSLFASGSSSKYIDMVKNGHPVDYPDSTYGEAFDAFFSNPKWEYFKSTEEDDVVEFQGGCTYSESDVVVTLQFILDVDAGTFEAGYFDMNGIPQNQLFTAALIEKVFSE